MSEMEKHVLKHLAVACMYVLAAPLLLFQWLKKLRKDFRAVGQIRSGVFPCPYCQFENPLNRMATCPRCRASEPGSVLRCTFCKASFRTITCESCGATLRVA